MNQYEGRAKGVPPSKTTLWKEHENQTKAQRICQQRIDTPEPSCVCMKKRSLRDPIDFKDGHQSVREFVNQQSSEDLRGQSVPQHQTDLDSILMVLEENIISYVMNEMKKIQKILE